MTLSEKTCVPCRGGIPPLSSDEARRLLSEIPQWRLTHEATRIERNYKLKNFRQALALVNQIGELAEAQAHHPDITFGWGYCTVVFYTHKIKGLHENDFIMASKVDALYEGLIQGE